MALRIAAIQGNTWPSKSFTYCKPFQVGFFVQLCSGWYDFKWQSASRDPSAIVEHTVFRSQTARWRCARYALRNESAKCSLH